MRRQDPTLEVLSEDRWRAFTRLSLSAGAKGFAVVRKQARMVGILTSTLLLTTQPPRRHFRIVVYPNERRREIGTILLQHVDRQDTWTWWFGTLPAFPVVLPAGCAIRPFRGTHADISDWLRLDHEGYSHDPDARDRRRTTSKSDERNMDSVCG